MIYNINREESLKVASSKILNGEVIIYPTDTIYGFGVDATNNAAVDRLNKIKKRKLVYSIMVSSIDMLAKYCEYNLTHDERIKKYLPGPYTIILSKKNSNLSELVTLNLNTVGVRLTNNKFCNQLINMVNKPIVTTSVNVHGKKSLNNSKDINMHFPNIDIFQTNTINQFSKGSTILDFSKKSETLIRQGDGEIII